jgi:hypothetical protein
MKAKLFLMVIVIALATSLVNAELISTSMVVDDIEYYIQANDSVYDLGEDVEMFFSVTNLGSETLSFGTSYPIIDIIISEKTGEVYNEIWNWSWDEFFHTGPVLFKLEPGAPVELNGTWSQINLNNSGSVIDHTQVSAGIYEVSGYFNPTETSVAMDITIVPEPCSILLLGLGVYGIRRIRSAHRIANNQVKI